MTDWTLEDGEALPDERQDIVRLEVAELAELRWEDLTTLPALEELTINGWGIFDLDDLPVMPRLRQLTIDPCPDIEDVSGLLRQPACTELELRGGARTDLDRLKVETLARLTGLRLLRFYRDGLTDLSFVAGMTALEELDLISEELRDLGPVAACTSLRRLQLSGCNALGGVEALAGLPHLRELWLSGPVTADLAPLAGTPLERLVIQHLRIKDVSVDLASIARIASLNELEILSADLTGVAALAGSPVRELALDRCHRLSDLSAIGTLPHLETLRVTDARALERIDLGEPAPTLRDVTFMACRTVSHADIDALRLAHPGIDIRKVY